MPKDGRNNQCPADEKHPHAHHYNHHLKHSNGFGIDTWKKKFCHGLNFVRDWPFLQVEAIFRFEKDK